MKLLALATCLVITAWLALPGAVLASTPACKAGETRFQNGIFWTCVCASSGGRTSCGWRAD